MIWAGKKTDFTVIFKSKLGLCKLGHFEKVLHNYDARKAANLNDPNFSILFWIIGVFRQLMMRVVILARITGKNYDFLKLGYFFVFSVGSKFE